MQTANNEPIRFTRGVPAVESFPTERLIACAEAALRHHGDTLLQYHPVRGFLPLRERLATDQGVSPAEVMIGNGSIQLLALIAATFVAPGDAVLVERPTYDRTITTFRHAGAHVVGIPLESDGPDLAAFEAAIETHAPSLAYLIPDFQNPSGVTMSLEKRKGILALAEAHDLLIVTDVPYRPLRYWGEDVPDMHALAPDRVIRLSSFSKLISPGMRVGWMTAAQEIVDRVASLGEDTYISPGMLPQGIVHEFLDRGWMPENLARLKALYAPRLTAILAGLERHLPRVACEHPEGGFFLGLTLPEGVSGPSVRELAAERGVLLSDGTGFFADGDGTRFVRLPFCALSEAEIEEGLARLADAVAQAGGLTT